jgi:hypothetical protein
MSYTKDACKATHRIAAGEISLNNILDHRMEEANHKTLKSLLIFKVNKIKLERLRKFQAIICVRG